MAKGTMSGSTTELQFLNYILNKNSMHAVIINGLTEDNFSLYKEQFNFIKDYYNKYNCMPSRETITGKFPSFTYINVTDPEEYLVDKLRENKLYLDVVDGYNKMINLIKAEKTTDAVELMSQMSQKFLKQQQTTRCVDLISDAKLRYDSYISRVMNPNNTMVTTGLKELDEILGGWDMLNESAIIAARTGFGKSWWLIFFALQAAKQGLNVGFYSGEMETDLVGYRLDTFLGNIANGSLTHGNGDIADDYSSYIASINKVIPGHIYCITPEMINGSATVSQLRAFIDKYNIQFMCVDQLSLLEDERKGKSPREQMANISKDLRTLQRLKKIPIISAAQLNREDTSENGPSTRNIAESDRPGQDATTILFIERKDKQVIFTVGKARNAKTGDKLTYFWNINTGILNYVPTETDARGGEGVEDLTQQYNDTAKSSSVF